MALTVGELTALVTVEDETRQGLSDAESSVQQAGRRIGQDAERAGAQAGQQLGEGLADGADQGSEGMQDAVGGRVAGLGAALKGGALAAGAMIGAAIVMGIGEALDQSRIVGRLGAQLGKTPAEARKYGDIAGEMYADAITEDFQGAADAISATMRAGLLPPDATNKQIESISTKVSDLASTFELDLGQSANAVGQIMKTELAPNAEAALDVMTRGMQVMGPRADDLADTFNEYSTIFRSMGMSAEQATGIIAQGMKAGARDTDIVADAIKEFTIEAVAGSEKVGGGFESLGLDAGDMFDAISKGGKSANDALDLTLDELRRVEDPVKRNAIATELFGTKAEDLGDALYALDPSSAVDALGEVGGAAEDMGDTLRDNAGAKVERFKRTLEQGLVEFLGDKVIPAVEDFAETFGPLFSDLGRVVQDFWTEVEPHLSKLKTMFGEVAAAMTGKGEGAKGGGMVEKIGTVLGEVADIIEEGVTLVTEIWDKHGDQIMEVIETVWDAIGPYVESSLQVIKGVIQVLTGIMSGDWGKAWDGMKNIFGGMWGMVLAILQGVVKILIEVLKLGLSMLWGLVEDAWDWIVETTEEKWDEVVDWIADVPGKIQRGLSDLGSKVSEIARDAGQQFKEWLMRKVGEAAVYMAGTPGRIQRALGNLGSLLWGAGQDVGRGLLNGIKSMGGYIASTLRGWAASIIPGPIAQALGIASPSKVMARDVGRWIPLGIVKGIEGEAGAVDSAMRSLATVPPVPQSQVAGNRGMFGSASPYGGAAGGPLVQIDSWYAAENGTPEDNARALAWAAKARGR